MRTYVLATSLSFLALNVITSPTVAEAACSSSASDSAWGDFWVERSGVNCDCVIKIQEYPCLASSGHRDPGAAQTLATVSGDCSKNCEDLSGYDTAVTLATDKYKVAANAYECDSTYTDSDGDNFPACIDEDDSDPRKWPKKTGNESVCDGYDNDNDGTADDGFTACAKDQKRVYRSDAMQGNAAGAVNLISGAISRFEHLATIEGPFGPLAFGLAYDSRRETNESGVASGWTNGLTVYLKQQPNGDDRWRITIPSGEEEYFRCTSFANDMSCVSDDHHIAGNLRRISQVFYYYPGDGTRYAFDDTSFSTARLYDEHLDGGGFRISFATPDGSERPTKIETDNASIYLSFSYDSAGLSVVRLNSTSVKQLFDFDATDRTGGLITLDKIKFASALNTIDTDNLLAFRYDSGTQNMLDVTQKIDGSTTITAAEATYDGSDRVLTIKDASKDLAVTYNSSTQTTVDFNINGSPTSVAFTHNKHYATGRNSDVRMGGMTARSTVFDQHGRKLCTEGDDSRMVKYTYADSRRPTQVDVYGKSGNCASGGTIDHKIWNSWGYNATVQSPRLAWTRRTSAFSGSSNCSSSATNCLETAYAYLSSSDNRVQTLTTTGYTKLVDNSTPQQIRVQRMFYYGVDTGVCASSGDYYDGQVCYAETQDGSSAVLARTKYEYVATGATSGLLKAVKQYDSSSDTTPLTTTYASHNDFGSPGSVTSPAGVVTDYTYSGWNAVTAKTENDGLLDDGSPPSKLDRSWSYGYNKLRRLETTTLPEGNKIIRSY
jgi:hypothetical protein